MVTGVVMKWSVVAVILLLALVPAVQATTFGINYYHESMMSDRWRVPYIPTSAADAAEDLDHIKTVSSHVKFYGNPFVPGNKEWVGQLVVLAEQRGFHTVVNVMVDDRDLTDGNWQTYRNHVLNWCSYFSGSADEILVGNELTLHSSWNKYAARSRLEPLINDCKQQFSGKVSYSALWWEKEAWWDYPGEIYFMMYENFNSFTFNVNELRNRMGDRGLIGEWGEDSIDEGIGRDDWWQRLEIEKRWNVISNVGIPVAYIFTYKEPSWNGFGIVRPDGLERPVWDYLRTIADDPGPTCTPSTEVCDGLDNDCDNQIDEGDVCAPTIDIRDLPATCIANGAACTEASDVTSGSCRTLAYTNGIEAMGCEKENGFFELYTRAAPAGVVFEVCLANGCVNNNQGFARFIPDLSEGPTCTPTTEVCDGVDNDCDTQVDEGDVCAPPPGEGIESLALSCSAGGAACTLQTDTLSGTCRTALWNSGFGDIKVKGCEKDGGFIELYRQLSPSASFSACFADGCVDEHTGFVRFQPSGETPPPDEEPPAGDVDVMDLPVHSEPAGTLTGDIDQGACRTVQFSTSAGNVEAKICDKGNHFEMYLRSPANDANACVNAHCVGKAGGFASFT